MLEVAHANCKGLKLFYRLHKLLFDRGDSCLECFNRATKTVGLCQPVPVRYCTRGKRFFLSLLSITRRYNENRTRNVCFVIVSRSVFFSNSYIFVCCFILDDKSTPVFKTVPVHVATCQQHQIATSQILMVYTQNVCTCCIVVVGTHSRRFLL